MGTNQQFARTAGYVCLGLAVLMAMGMAFFFLALREHEEDRRRERMFPWPDDVAVIRVMNSEGTETLSEIREVGELAEIGDQLKQAPPAFFEEPEPAGRLYKLELRGVDEELLAIFLISDQRQGGGTIAGKIYPPEPKKHEVWRLSPGIVSSLVDLASTT